jgi:choline dehydrogenase-like flavoprotein
MSSSRAIDVRRSGGCLPRRKTSARPVVVCGGGAAGLAAALAAARRGAKVWLVEARRELGGTVAGALIHTLAGLYDSEGRILNEGLPGELIERLQGADPLTARRKMGRVWVLSACPNRYRAVVTRWVESEPQIRVLTGTHVTDIVADDQWIDVMAIAGPGGILRVRPRAVIDATGSAEVARLLDRSLVIDDDGRAAGGSIVRIRGIAPDALRFPKGIGIVRKLRDAAQAGRLPPLCAHAWIDEGIHPDEAYVKLMVPLNACSSAEHLNAAAGQARQAQTEVMSFLKRLPDFARAEVAQTGVLGVRDGGRVRGRYVLTGDDVRRGRSFPDGICRCAWPIEYWDPQQGVAIEYLPPGVSYEIPMRSLQIGRLRNFWMAGKCLSADREAHASARVAGACWAMGAAAGNAAATTTMGTREDWHDAESVRSIPSNRPAAAR